jgi:O-antigen/teichoic acid export membrane protein
MIRNFVKFSAAAFSAAFLFLLLVAAGRILGPRDFGRFSFALAFVLLFDPLLDPGLYHLLIREVARKGETGGQYLMHALVWKLMAVPFLFLAIHFVVPRLDPAAETLTAVYLIGGSQVLKSMKDAVRAAFIAGERFGRELISLGTERLALMVVGLAVLQLGGGLFGLAMAFLIVRLFDLALAWILVRGPLGEISFRLEPKFLWTMLVSGVPIGAYYVTANLYSYLDTVMLTAMRTQTEVGQYNAAYRVYEGMSVIPLIISTVLMPRLSRAHERDPEQFDSIFSGGLKYAYGIGALATLNGLLLAPVVIRFFFGEGYLPAIGALQILAAGFPVVFSLNFINSALISMNRAKVVFVAAIVGLALNAGLNTVLIAKYSHNGAAAATVIVEALLFAALCVHLRRDVARVATPVFGTVTIAALLATPAAYLAARWGSVLQVVFANAVFLTVTIFLGFVGAPERRALADALAAFRQRLGMAT